jgi:hypothetical protein
MENHSHDTHYKELEAKGVCVIKEMENVMCIFFPYDQEIAKMALSSALAKKYELRAGTKDDKTKDFDKMCNYAHRAQFGTWPWEVK